MNQALVAIGLLLELAKTINSDVAKAQAEGRELNAEEQARVDAAMANSEQIWAALAPK